MKLNESFSASMNGVMTSGCRLKPSSKSSHTWPEVYPMGCASSVSVKSNTSQTSLNDTTQSNNNVKGSAAEVSPEVSAHVPAEECLANKPAPKTKNSGIAFEVSLAESKEGLKNPPKRLSRLDPIEGPRLTAEELEEKLRLAERKRNNQLETRAKTALESRKRSKRKRELMVARELERQHEQARELESKLKSAERQREQQQQQKHERQKLQEERIKRAQLKKEKLLLDEDILSDVEKDENFNNDDVDSWLEGSNNETNTVDTGFSSATSDRIYYGRKKTGDTMRSSAVTSLSAVDSCNAYKESHENLRTTSILAPQTRKEDDFYDT
ncbi:putative uncharacterized protein DDB_G0274435 [Watersipora subatra]|uniref:putative uncharacterized protein DDB_G0274435 n=1 Tax=Watersipora subatra TaxID=2589382 RepID=UPI00355C7790